jgi:hypothetical protein
MKRAALIVLALACAGCGGAHESATVTTTARKAAPEAPLGLRVGFAGALDVAPVRGVRFVRGPIATMPALPLVLASAESAKLTDVLAAARRYPTSHYAYVGGSLSGSRQPNVVGVVLRDDEAARLGGFVAGLVAGEEGGVSPRVAWVGPEEQELAAAIGRGAVALMAHRGLCADATVAGAHQPNDVGLRTSDFELANVPVGVLVRDAQNGLYHGGEDLVFGAASGAIGVGHLDRRISGEAGVRARAAAQQMANGLRPSG